MLNKIVNAFSTKKLPGAPSSALLTYSAHPAEQAGFSAPAVVTYL
jgi:hypothetical protein